MAVWPMPMDPETLEKLRIAGRAAGSARAFGASLIRGGATLLSVAEAVEGRILEEGAQVAFPVNIAIDDYAAHYTPRHDEDTAFRPGQLVKLDVGAHVDGLIGDTAVTVEVDTDSRRAMIEASREALMKAVELIRPGVDLGIVGGVIESTITARGFRPVRNLTGHSMEPYNLHAGLSIPNVPEPFRGHVKEGDVLAIEPFATDGAGRVINHKQSNIFRLQKEKYGSNEQANELLRRIVRERRTLPFSQRWCERASPNSQALLRRLISSRAVSEYPILREFAGGMVTQAEHTVVVTADGCEVLTLPL